MKVALIGSAASSIRLAPFQDKAWAQFQQGKQQAYPPTPHIEDTWQLWGCSPGAFGALPRFTRFFEVHRWEPGQAWFSPEYCQFLRDFQGPVYMGGPVPEVKNCLVYPKHEVEAEFSSYFLTSSLSLMAAIAIMEIEHVRKVRLIPNASDEQLASLGVSREDYLATDQDDVIGYWGVDMAANEEYGYQRAGCQFFILEALRRGIGVYVPPESDLIRPMPIYGLCEWDHNYIKLTARARELTGRVAEKTKLMQEAQSEILALNGARDDLNYMVNTWTSKFGMEAGVVLRHDKGTGLGGGVSHVDGTPVNVPVPATAFPVESIPVITPPEKGNGAAHPE